MRAVAGGSNGGPDLDDVRALRAYAVFHYRRLKHLDPHTVDPKELGDKETMILYRGMLKQAEMGQEPRVPDWARFPFRIPGT
jgi:hypothetical protein